MMWWVRDGWGVWAWGAMSVGMIAFWVVVVWAVAAVLRRSRFRDDGPTHARAILDERYARGEIDDDEYRARFDMLSVPTSASPR